MIPEAREVHLSRKDRKVLEACCRSPVTLQRDLKRARIVLLAADGRSTRSIAKEVGVQPRIVSLWRHRYADHGLEAARQAAAWQAADLYEDDRQADSEAAG
ncbi:FixJ family two-component response regulator [Bradyrhizobium diazoefficiens]